MANTINIFVDTKLVLLDRFNLIGYHVVGLIEQSKYDYVFLLQRGKQLYRLIHQYEPDCDGSYYITYIEKTYINLSRQTIIYRDGCLMDNKYKSILEQIEYIIESHLRYEYAKNN